MRHFAITLSLALLAICGAAGAAGGLSPISNDQLAKIQRALQPKASSPELVAAISEAAPSISSFLEINSCLPGYNASALNVLAAPGKLYPSFNYLGAPMPLMRRHSKSTCVSVFRVHGWVMPSKNALRFEVVYVAEDSGESERAEHEVQRQPGGEWLFVK